MLLRPFLNDAGSCASYLFGCTTHSKLAVVDAHVDLVDEYVAAAAAIGSPIVAVFETHVQADHVSGLPALVERTGATAYLPDGAGVEFEHAALADGAVVALGNTVVTAIATPGHAPGHQSLAADLPESGRVVLCGDAAFTRENLERGVIRAPDEAAAEESLAYIRSLVKDDLDRAFASHDMAAWSGWRSAPRTYR